jgi:hypothetical protein
LRKNISVITVGRKKELQNISWPLGFLWPLLQRFFRHHYLTTTTVAVLP